MDFDNRWSIYALDLYHRTALPRASALRSTAEATVMDAALVRCWKAGRLRAGKNARCIPGAAVRPVRTRCGGRDRQRLYVR